MVTGMVIGYGYDYYGLWVTVMPRLRDGSFSTLLTRFHNWEVRWFNVHFESFLDPGRSSSLTYVFLCFNSLDLGWCNLGYLEAKKQRDLFSL